MNTKFRVYRSVSVTYLKAVIIAFPAVAFWLGNETGQSWLYGVGVLCIILAGCIYAMLSASVTVSQEGIRLRRLGRSIEIRWEELRSLCRAVATPVGYTEPVRIWLFSRKEVDLYAIENAQSLPEPSPDLIFVTEQPGLLEALRCFAPPQLRNGL